MKINKHNYEEFFLLYTDNELGREERKAVEDFIIMYPELKEELDAVLQTRLLEKENVAVFDKSLLYRSETAGESISLDNYETYFLRYADDELTVEEKRAVENFTTLHAAKKHELNLLLRAKLQPEAEIVFKNKAVLYRHEKPVVSIAFQWRKMVAAASILLIGALVWTNFERVEEQFKAPEKGTEISAANQAKVEPGSVIKQQDKIENKVVTPGIKDESIAPLRAPQATIKKKPTSGNETSEKSAVNLNEHKLAEVKIDRLKVAVNETDIEQKNIVAATDHRLNLENKIPNNLPAEVKPVILDEAAFNGNDENDNVSNTRELALSDADNTEKKSKGPFRGLIRKASRFVNRSTNADDQEGRESIVRIASFEIVKK